MIVHAKDWLKARWPRLRLRTVLFATLFVVAALPGFGAVFLRVYENTLVRQTEAELIAQGAALAAVAARDWRPGQPYDATDARPEMPRIDLSTTPILPERPAPASSARIRPDAARVADRLASVFLATHRTTLAAIVMLDADGSLLAGPGKGRSYRMLPEVAAALTGHTATVLRRNGEYRPVYAFEWLSRAAAIRVHHARPIVVGGRVVGVLLLSRSARSLFKGLYEDRGKIALGIAAILGALFFLTALLSRSIARPVEALSAATRTVAAGGGTVPAPPATAALEIQDLYRDFAIMAAAIERRSRYLRDFAHAVSHEFKTPLAGIRGALELLAEHDMAEGERRRFLANADADARRLQLLVTRLLELARADMSRGGEATTDVASVLAAVIETAPDGLTIANEVPDLPPVAIPASSLERILVTLIDNSRQAGARRVTLSATLDRHVTLAVADDGPGIAPADRARVFEPFFTTHRTTGGSGLGLAIARSLLDAAGGGIELVESDGGARFALTLPLAV